MTPPAMLRVIPTGHRPCPSHDGKKLTQLLRAAAPIGGFLVPDNLFNRRRVRFGELHLVAEGAAALPKREPIVPEHLRRQRKASPPVTAPPPAAAAGTVPVPAAAVPAEPTHAANAAAPAQDAEH